MATGQAAEGGPDGAELRLFLLGGFRVERAGSAIPDSAWVRPRAATLVKLLAVEPSHRLHREHIVDLLWPDSVPGTGSANLRKLLHYARHALDGDARGGATASLLPTMGDSVALDADRLWIDVDVFESAARRALTTGAPDDLQIAEGLYGGELLPQDRYETWTEQRREDLATLAREVSLRLTSTLTDSGRNEDAAACLRKLLAADPADEAAHRGLMRLYAAQGDFQQALRQYRRCKRALEEHLAVQPSEETEALYCRITSGEVVSIPRTHIPLPAAVRHPTGVPLIARARALELIWQDRRESAGRDTGTDRRPVVFIGGAAGVGKTRLAAEAARAAEQRDAIVLWAGASGLEGRVPYGPFAEALEEYVSYLPAKDRAELAAKEPELGRLLPSLGVGKPARGDPRSEQMRLFAAVARLLDSAAGDRTVVMVLDDLHQSDVPSLQLLRYLSRLAPDRGWLILGTYREEGLPGEGALQALLSELQRSGLSRHVDLLPLGKSDCDLLVRSLLGPTPVDAGVFEHVFALSQGNPLFVTELVASLRASDTLDASGGSWMLADAGAQSRLPLSLTTVIGGHIRSLGEETHSVLSVAAVAGMVFDPEIVLAAVGKDEDATAAALDRAVEVHVLEERDRAYAFSHPLIRETLYQGLSGLRRTRAHEALGRALEARGSRDLDALAHHFARGADAARALVYLERAAEKAADAYANEIAEEHYRDLLIRLEPLDRPADLAHTRGQLGRILSRMARASEALAELSEASAIYRRLGDIRGLTRVAASIGEVHGYMGQFEIGLTFVDGVLAEIEDSADSLSIGRLQLSRANLFYGAGTFEAQLQASTRAITAITGTESETVEHVALLAAAYLLQGTAHLALGRIGAGRASLEAARDLALRTDNLELLGRAYYNLAWASMLHGDLDDHLTACRACLDTMVKTGAPGLVALARTRLGLALFQVGDWQQARALLNQALAEVPLLESPERCAVILTQAGLLSMAAGDLGAARTTLEETLAYAQQQPGVHTIGAAAFYLAELDMAEGRPDFALDHLGPLLPGAEQTRRSSYDALRVLGGASWAHAELGNLHEAECLSVMAIERARETDARFYLLENLCHRGHVLAAQQRWDEAGDSFREALELSRQMGFTWREACVLSWWSRMETRRGCTDRARELALAAAAIYRRHGADRVADRLLSTPAMDNTSRVTGVSPRPISGRS